MNSVVGLTVSVGYGEKFRTILPSWLPQLDEFIVVTHESDKLTQEAAKEYGVRCVLSDSFYENGAYFDKAGALQEIRSLHGCDFELLLDADVMAPPHWREVAAGCEPGFLYGATRVSDRGTNFNDFGVIGFHMLFHKDDPHNGTLGRYMSCASYDTDFVERWPVEKRRILPISLTHLGEPPQNQVTRDWCGVGQFGKMAALFQKRVKMGGWEHEKIC